jgi:AraC-like DNA-binding protein
MPENYIQAGRRLETLVENRTHYAMESAALNVYETHQYAERIALQFKQPVLASMLKGKKVMHLRDRPSFDFFPGESVVLPADELMVIDFPEATMENPTHCLALEIDEQQIINICHQLNEQYPKIDQKSWKVSDDFYHFTNDVAVKQILDRLIFLFMEDHPSQELFANMMLKELIVRLMQTQSRFGLVEAAEEGSQDRLSYVIQYIQRHLSEDISIEDLSKKACMSTSHFYRTFRNEMGMSPVNFIMEQRIAKAKKLLKETNLSIQEVGYRCGFNNLSYFNRVFKREEALTPTNFRMKESGMNDS